MENKINVIFDEFIEQTITYGISHERYENGTRYEKFVQVKEWKSKFGYTFSVYSNDHLIDGKRHFHFDNSNSKIFSKIDFEGNILEEKGGNSIPSNIKKELVYFLKKDGSKKMLNDMWDKLNPPTEKK